MSVRLRLLGCFLILAVGVAIFLVLRSRPLAAHTLTELSESAILDEFQRLDGLRWRAMRAKDTSLLSSVFTPDSELQRQVEQSIRAMEAGNVTFEPHVVTRELEVIGRDVDRVVVQQKVQLTPSFIHESGADLSDHGARQIQVIEWVLVPGDEDEQLLIDLGMVVHQVDVVGSGARDHGGASQPFGIAARPNEADRRIVIRASDAPSFRPRKLHVAKGATVLFVVKNSGEVEHEFLLGNPQMQKAVQQGSENHAHPGSLTGVGHIGPGNVLKVAWKFTKPGKVVYACHVADHYQRGMRGVIDVR